MFEITRKIHTVVSGTSGENDDCYHKGRGRGSESYDGPCYKGSLSFGPFPSMGMFDFDEDLIPLIWSPKGNA